MVSKMAFMEHNQTKLHLPTLLKVIYYFTEHLGPNALKFCLHDLFSFPFLQQILYKA
jgi:hypothetical protein